MGDLYGISNAVMEANSLHGQIALNEEVAQRNYQNALDKFNKTIKDAKSADSTANDKEYAEDLPELNSVYQTGAGLYGGYKGAKAGARGAELSFRLNTATSARNVAARRAAEGRAVASDTAESERLASQVETPAAAAAREAAELTRPAFVNDALSGIRSAGTSIYNAGATTLDLAKEGVAVTASAAAEGTRYAGAVGAGAAKGFIAGATEAGGIGTKAGGELTGLGGIVKTTLTRAGAGEEVAQFAGKNVGAVGGLVTAGQQIDSLIESGGKSMFTRVNAQGQRVAMSGTDKAGEILSEAGSVADVVAAGSGGLFVPVAAALSLAGAAVSAIGEYKDEKADDKNIGLKPDGTTDATKAPKLSAPVQTEAFTGLGFLGNMTHNPLDHIS